MWVFIYHFWLSSHLFPLCQNSYHFPIYFVLCLFLVFLVHSSFPIIWVSCHHSWFKMSVATFFLHFSPFLFHHLTLSLCPHSCGVALFSSSLSLPAPHLYPHQLWACLSHDCHLCRQLPVPGFPSFLLLPIPKLCSWDSCLHLLSGRIRDHLHHLSISIMRAWFTKI